MLLWLQSTIVCTPTISGILILMYIWAHIETSVEFRNWNCRPYLEGIAQCQAVQRYCLCGFLWFRIRSLFSSFFCWPVDRAHEFKWEWVQVLCICMCSPMRFTNWKTEVCKSSLHMCLETSRTTVAQSLSLGHLMGINLFVLDSLGIWPPKFVRGSRTQSEIRAWELPLTLQHCWVLLLLGSSGNKSSCGGGGWRQVPTFPSCPRMCWWKQKWRKNTWLHGPVQTLTKWGQAGFTPLGLEQHHRVIRGGARGLPGPKQNGLWCPKCETGL